MSDSTNSDKQHNLGAACFRCRGFRHACDRRKPSCSRCHRRGINCVYPEAAPTLKNLQKDTETLGDRIKKFSDKIKTDVTCQPIDIGSPMTDSIISIYSEEGDDDDTMSEKNGPKRRSRASSKVASTNSFSVYPCTKCFKDLQQCDLTLPKCSRCEANDFECTFKKNEPKANHVSQVLTTMNKVMDQWQDSIDRMAREFAQKTRELSSKANFIIKPIPPPTSWRINSTKKGLSIESNVNSYHDLSTMVDQVKQTVTITPREENNKERKGSTAPSTPHLMDEPIIEFDDTSSIHTASGFAIWNQWSHPTHAMPQDYPIDISQELTDNLVELYFRTPCCSSIRLPIIDATDFLLRYRDPDPSKRPSEVLIYAICAMSARNAFQLHVWSKRPSFGAPQYNMGKALSVAYCLRGREQLADCFDEPTFDNCQAAFLLSYCNYQNGYPGVIYFYEWIAYTMALQLGLYDQDRKLTKYESMLIWCIYYCNAWYKSLQGSNNGNSNGVSQCKPKCPIPSVLDRPDQSLFDKEGVEPNERVIDYYVWNTWVYLINLQVLRDQSIAKFVSYQMNGRLDGNLPQDLLAMQETLKEFHQSLPNEWQSPNLDVTNNKHQSCTSESTDTTSETYHVDTKSFGQYCINFVSLHYSINQIILYQAFVPMGRLPSTPISIQCLETCLNAASNISQISEQMAKDCHVPLVGFLFASIIYRKLLSYPNEHYYELGKFALLRSVDTSKASINFKYDFEMARTLVTVMERDIQFIILQRPSSSCFMDSSVDSSPSPSIPSPPNYNSLGQAIKEW